MDNTEQLLTCGAAARLAGVSDDTIRLWSKRGRLASAFVTTTGVRLFRRDDVLRAAGK